MTESNPPLNPPGQTSSGNLRIPVSFVEIAGSKPISLDSICTFLVRALIAVPILVGLLACWPVGRRWRFYDFSGSLLLQGRRRRVLGADDNGAPPRCAIPDWWVASHFWLADRSSQSGVSSL